MKKHKFTNAQRFAIWHHYGQLCYWCKEPLRLHEATIDHVIPEHLDEKPKELAKVKASYSLSETFIINDYCNWVPCHDHCNKSKGMKVFKPAPILIDILQKLRRESEAVRKIEQRVLSDKEKDKLMGKVMTAVEKEEITQEEILALFKGSNITGDEDVRALYHELYFHVNPERWKIVGKSGDIAIVTDGKRGGMTPVTETPHLTWACPTCGSFGPWNGTRCLNCGEMSDPNY